MVRQCHLSDLPYLYEICHLTGLMGKDATGVVSDRFLLGQLYAAPYVIHDPRWCWVAVDDLGPVGYLVATPDSREFTSWMNSFWLPGLRILYQGNLGNRWSDFEEKVRNQIKEKEDFPSFSDAYPAHLHIDVLPRAQGKGVARELMGRFLDRIREDSVSGFHLGVNGSNGRALAFYEKLGFQVITNEPWGVYLGRKF